MYKHEAIFILNDHEKLVISGGHIEEQCCCCCEIPIMFFAKETQYDLGTIVIGMDLSFFSKQLEKALAKELKLHKSITKDIGYSWNIEQHYFSNGIDEAPGFVYEKVAGRDSGDWVGDKYELFLYPSNKFGIWLYNADDGSIIFEIAPLYPWFHYDPETQPEPEGFIPFEEFMKNYQPTLIRTIPPDVAQKWAEQAKFASDEIYAIVAREQEEYNQKIGKTDAL